MTGLLPGAWDCSPGNDLKMELRQPPAYLPEGRHPLLTDEGGLCFQSSFRRSPPHGPHEPTLGGGRQTREVPGERELVGAELSHTPPSCVPDRMPPTLTCPHLRTWEAQPRPGPSPASGTDPDLASAAVVEAGGAGHLHQEDVANGSRPAVPPQGCCWNPHLCLSCRKRGRQERAGGGGCEVCGLGSASPAT